MKISQVFVFFLLIIIISTSCEKQNFGDLNASYVYIPNVINLNSQDNNIFYISAVSDNPDIEFTVVVMEIFDRYGSTVYMADQFPANDSTYGWDGIIDGNSVESGTYTYSIRISDGTNSKLFGGDFTVLV